MAFTRHTIVDALDTASLSRAALWLRAGMRSAAGIGLAVAVLRPAARLPGSAPYFDVIILAVLALMTAEYALRIFAAPAGPHAVPGRARAARIGYLTSPVGLVDLAAVAPMALALATAAPTREVTALAVLWVLKLARYSSNLGVLGRVLRDARKPLMSVLLLFGSILLLAAAAAHVLEGERQPAAFGSIARSLWWAVATLTTTGYGDAVPQSAVGRLVAGVVMVSGLGVIALWAGILTNGFSQELQRRDFLKTWELVSRVPLFRDVGAQAIAEVARLLRPSRVPTGATVFWRGQRGDCMYFIASGRVEVEVDDRTVDYGPGEFFGEIALVAGGLRTGTALTREPCTLLILDVADFHELASRQPELSQAIHSAAARRLERSHATRGGA